MQRAQVVRAVSSAQPVKAAEPVSLSNFACNVFTDREIASRIPKAAYKSYKAAVKAVRSLDAEVADVIANAMKDWAVERGATHFTHWFQPIHISTAEKHEAFLTPRGDDFKVILEFTGEQLVRGEPDASSFPNGGTRSTSRARGYTTWDPTSPAFIRAGTNGATLYIPTCFCSWTGDALDVKTPLLRSTNVLSTQAVRLLRLLGDTEVESVQTTLGAEQEFFVVDRSFYAARPDLVFSGRTLFGAKPPKGQELEDHYFATIPSRVFAYVQEVEHELWKVGIPTRARHNEVAPGQHEMAPVFEFSNIAADHNMIQMEVLREVASRHGLATLLHEKPFTGVNGSGKHNNWSMATNTGLNLLEPSNDPRRNVIFQVFLACILRAVDVHADLLRSSIATPGNDWRLGHSEAPPAIMSCYLGAEILGLVEWIMARDPDAEPPAVTEQIERDMHTLLHLGASAVAPFRRDRTDRNRTSPFAFTGNKFEFRAVGSTQNVGHTVTVLNTIVADSIRAFADQLETAVSAGKTVETAIIHITKEWVTKHFRIVFEGDGYSEEWVIEAAKRGLPNFRETVGALEAFASEKNSNLFSSLGVLNHGESRARYHIYLEHYNNTINVEANSAIHISDTLIVPAVFKFQKHLGNSINAVTQAIGEEQAKVICGPQVELLKNVTLLLSDLISQTSTLKATVAQIEAQSGLKGKAEFTRDQVKPKMLAIREVADKLETLVEDKLWPLPKYTELLFTK